MDTLYTFGDNITHYKTESVHFLGLMNSATKIKQPRLRGVPPTPAAAAGALPGPGGEIREGC